MKPTSKPTAVKLPESQLREIVRAVLASPYIQGFMKGWGADPNEIERASLRKLARFVLRKDVKAAAANVRTLERRLAKEGNPVVRAELSRRLELEFAKLEGSSK